MEYRSQTKYEFVTPTRFLERAVMWTGEGVQGYPWIYARFGKRLHARVHGRAFWDGQRRIYTIDLGETIPAGSVIDLVTQSLFVDEAGTFERHLGYHAPRPIARLTMTVAFTLPPGPVTYSYRKSEDSEDCLDQTLREISRWEKRAFEYVAEPCGLGDHLLEW